MKKQKQGLFFAALMVVGLPNAFAQLEIGGDLLESCSRIEGHRNSGNYAEARDAARLCLEGLEQELEGEIGQYFLMEVAGWRRTSFEQNKVMGFSNTSARYQKNGMSVTVSLTGGAGGAFGLGALGGFASLAILQSGRQVRVAGLPAVINPDGSVMVPLEDGSFLSFESSDFNDADSALSGMGDLVDAFPVADINRTLVEG